MKYTVLCSLMCIFAATVLPLKAKSVSAASLPAWMFEANPTPIPYTPPAPTVQTPAQLLTQLENLNPQDLQMILSKLNPNALLSVLAPATNPALPQSSDTVTNNYLQALNTALTSLSTVITDTMKAQPFNGTTLGKQVGSYLSAVFINFAELANS